MTRRLAVLASLAAFASFSCSSDSSGPDTTTLSGIAQDYETHAALNGATVALLEDPSSTTTTDASGNFSLSDLTRNNSVRMIVTGTSYSETLNPIRLLGNKTVNQNAFAVSTAFVNNQYTAVGVLPTAGTATIIAQLEDDLGTPRAGIPLADITLLDQNQAPAGTGPYIFGAGGTLDNQLVVTTTFNGTSRIAFLDVPPGNYTLTVIDGANQFARPLAARSDGVTLVVR